MGAEIIQTIGVALTAELSPLGAGLAVGLNAFKKFTQEASDILEGLNDKIKESFSRVSEQFRISGNLRTTIGEFQALTYSAEQTNTPLNALTQSFKMFERNLGMALLGSERFRTVFRYLHLDMKSLATMDISAAYEHVGEALNAIGNTAQRTAIAMAIFGRSGNEMLSFFDGMKGKESEFAAITRPITEIDGAKINGAWLALKKVETVWHNIYDVIASHIAPVVTNLIDDFLELGVNGKTIGDSIDDAFDSLEAFATTALSFGMAFKDMWPDIWADVKTVFSAIGDAFEALSKDIGSFIVTIAPALHNLFHAGDTFRIVKLEAMADQFESIIKDKQYEINYHENVKGDGVSTGSLLELLGYQNKLVKIRDEIAALTVPLKSPVENDNIYKIGKAMEAGQFTSKIGNALAVAFEQWNLDPSKYKEDAKRIISSVFHGKAEKDAIMQAFNRETERNRNGELAPPMNKIPLGFAENLTQFGGNPMLNAIALSMARTKVATQPVRDDDAIALLDMIQSNTSDQGWGVAE